MASAKDYLHLHFLVFLWSFTAILGKLMSLPAVEMVLYRTLLATIGVGVLLMVVHGGYRVSAGDFWKLIATGLIVALHWLAFFVSGRISNPSTSLVGFATCSLWAALIEPMVNKKKIQVLEVALGTVVLAGLCIIFSFNFHYTNGLLLGILSGLTAAIFGVINSKLVSRVSSYTITFYEMLGASIGLILFLPVYQQLWSAGHQLQLIPSVMDWIYLSILAFVCTVYAYASAISLTKRLSVFSIQLTLNLEPVYGIALALLIFGQQEVMGANFYVGTLLILLAVALYPFLKWRFQIGR